MGQSFTEPIHRIQARNVQFALRVRGGGAACSSSGSWSSAWGTDLGCIPLLVLPGCSLLQRYTQDIQETEKAKELTTMSLASPKVKGHLSPFSAVHVFFKLYSVMFGALVARDRSLKKGATSS